MLTPMGFGSVVDTTSRWLCRILSLIQKVVEINRCLVANFDHVLKQTSYSGHQIIFSTDVSLNVTHAQLKEV